MPEQRRFRRFALLPIVAVLLVAVMLVTFHGRYPLQDWLLFRVLGYWALAAYWAVGCLGAGVAIVERLLRDEARGQRPAETAAIGFPMGVLAFGVAVFGVGLFGLLNTAFFVVAPAIFALAGRDSLRRIAKALWGARARLGAFRPTPIEVAALIFTAVGLVAVYLPLLTPHNLQHDARWYHLPLAQQYASSGRVARFPEGWFLAAYPHLASFLYAWAFLLPAGIVHRLGLCAHLELIVFLATQASLVPLVRRLVPGVRWPLVLAATFLFPRLLVYDSNLSTGADHIAAVFAPAGLLSLLATFRTFSPRHAVLAGAAAAGAALTKYSSAVCVSVPLAVFFVLGVFVHRRGEQERAQRLALAFAASFLVCWAPHWLANYVWYGNPVYPMLGDSFRSRPWDPLAASYLRVFMDWGLSKPSHDLTGALESVRAAFTLGFRDEEHGFNSDIPAFGFLFTATLYCLPFLRPPRFGLWRNWLVHGLGVVGTLGWFWTNHHERYLQASMPWLVAATVSALALVWRSGRGGRASAAALVGVQIACGAGLFFLPSYFMVPDGQHPLLHTRRLIADGYGGLLRAHPEDVRQRFEPYEEWNFAAWTALGRLLPLNARVLVHEDRLWIGLDRPVVVDEAQWQAGIRYVRAQNASDVYDQLSPYGITHIVTGRGHGDSGDHGLMGDLAFFDFVTRHASFVATKGKLTVWKMPDHRPDPEPLGRALILTCNQSLPSGLYEFPNIVTAQPSRKLSPKEPIPDDAVASAEFLVLEDECGFPLEASDFPAFELMSSRRHVSYFRRK